MAPCIRRLLPWLVAAAAAGCSSHRGPPLRVVIAHNAADGQHCFPAAGAAQTQDTSLASANVATLRLTVRRHAMNDEVGSFLCDRVLSVPRDAPAVEIPSAGQDKFDLYGEAYAAPATSGAVPQRLAVGALLNVPFSAKTLPDLRLYPTESFACANQRMQRPRAFHSATLLPNGQVLIVGGLTSGSDPTVDTFFPTPLYVAADAEIYDPATGAFTTVTEAATPAPRAFHQAALVNATPPYQILLVGGLTVADTRTPAMGLNTGAASGTRLVPFDTSQLVPNPLTTTAAAAEVITYDPASKTITRAPFAGFTPGVFQAGATFTNGLAVADGIDWKGNPEAATIPQVKQLAVDRALEMPPRTAAPAIPRLGATLTPIGDNNALLWGGQIVPTDAPGAWTAGLGAGNAVSDTALPAMTTPVTQFHTATAAAIDATSGTATVVVTGGFVQTTTNGGQALQPPTADVAPRLLTVTSAGAVTIAKPTLSGFTTDLTCADAMRYKPAGWEAATALSRQRVLVSGGAPTAPVNGSSCNDCDGGQTLLCASKQGAIFTAPATLARTGSMQVPRFGHTATLTRDDNVLILGGIGSGGGTPHVLWDAEQYDPRPGVPLVDATTGIDPDDPIAAELAAGMKSRAPAQPLSAQSLCGEL